MKPFSATPNRSARSIAAVHQQGGQNLEKRFCTQGDLGNCEGKREELWLGNDRTARLCDAPVRAYVIRAGELRQIQFLLGDVSIQTTERYLGCKQR
jgi:hypothetical protein